MSEEVMMQYSKVEELNRIWEVIEDAIIKVGKKVLPSKIIKSKLEKQNPRSKECKDLKAIKLLSILISAIRKNRDSRSAADWRKWNKLINRINHLVETQISSVQSNTVENWINEALTWWKILKNKILEENCKTTKKEIREFIRKRNERIDKEQKIMLNSILDRSCSKVCIDRLLCTENSEEKLIIEEEEVLRETAHFFQNQYRSRSLKLNQMNEEWRKVYQPIER